MYCKSCGKQIDDNSKFCRFCGQKLAGNNDLETASSESIIKRIVSFFKNPKSKALLSPSYIGVAAIMGILVYLFALTITSEILHTLGLSRIEKLNQDISMYLGIVAVIIAEIKFAIYIVDKTEVIDNL